MSVTRHIQIISLLLFLGIAVAAFGQESTKQLEAKRKQLEADIAYTNKLISETRKSKQLTVGELKLLNNRLNKRNELIVTLKKEITNLDIKILVNEQTVSKLSRELEELKQEYSVDLFIFC